MNRTDIEWLVEDIKANHKACDAECAEASIYNVGRAGSTIDHLIEEGHSIVYKERVDLGGCIRVCTLMIDGVTLVSKGQLDKEAAEIFANWKPKPKRRRR